MTKTNKSNANFLIQGSILALASIISRIIGLLYRIPMTNILGDIGNGYYSCAYEIYSLMLIISSSSLPLAVSKLISIEIGKGNTKQIKQIFKCSMIFAGIISFITAIIVWFGADFFTGTLLKTPYSSYALKVLAPTLIFVAFLGIVRGFFQGMGNMQYSAISQVIEQIVNAIVSVVAAYGLFQYGVKIGEAINDSYHLGPAYGAAGGTLGTCLGALAGLLFMLLVYYLYVKKLKQEDIIGKEETSSYTFKILALTILPILLSSTIFHIASTIDQGIFKNIMMFMNYNSDDVDVSWGIFTGKYKLLANVPIAISSAISVSAVPSLTTSFTQKKIDDVNNKIAMSTKFTMLVSMPSAMGLAVLAKPILLLLFPSTAATISLSSNMMVVGAIGVVFYSLSTLTNGLLQGIDKLKTPIVNSAIALVIHDIILVILLMVFKLEIYAIVITYCSFAGIICILNAISLNKYVGYKQEYKNTMIMPIICSMIMGLITYGVYYVIDIILPMTIACMISIIVAIIAYAILIIKTKVISEEELKEFPKGNLIIKVCKKCRILS